MSTLKVNKLRDTAGSADAITLDPNGGAVLAGVTTMTTARVTSGIVTNTFIVGAGVTISESGIEASGIGITCANINGGAIGGRRNLILNGAMNIAQRGTSSTSTGYQTVDRFEPGWANLSTGGNITISQQSLSSGSPYNEGFRKFLRMALPAAGTAAANSYAEAIIHRFEAQHIANSGWDYTSSSSFVTLSFWFRASTNQTFYGLLRSEDGTSRSFSFPFTATGNDAWTKITKTIPGNTSPTIQVDNDNGRGFSLFIIPFYGTNYTTSGHTSNAWQTYSSSNIVPDMADTWLTAGASTFDITGLQLEVGSQATAFEHLSIGEDLILCQRYYQRIGDDTLIYYGNGNIDGPNQAQVLVNFITDMRTAPSSLETSGTASDYFIRVTTNATCTSVPTLSNRTTKNALVEFFSTSHGFTSGHSCFGRRASGTSDSFLAFSAEL